MKKALIALLAVLLVVAAVLGLNRLREWNAARPGHAFSGVRMDEAVRVSVRTDTDSMTLMRGPSGWRLAGDAFPADTLRLARVFSHLAGLQTRETVADSADAATLAEYGFGPGRERLVEWEDARGHVRRVVFGKLSGIDYGSVFWKPFDAPQVYRTPGKFVWEFSPRAMDWKDTNLYHPRARFQEKDVRAVEVEWWSVDDGGAVPLVNTAAWRLERSGGGGFVLTYPDTADTVPADSARAARVFRHAAQFRIDGFVPGEDPSRHRAGLDAPVMTVRIELADGTRHEIVAGAVVDGLYRYVRHASHPDPVRVFAWRFDYFAKRAEELAIGAGRP